MKVNVTKQAQVVKESAGRRQIVSLSPSFEKDGVMQNLRDADALVKAIGPTEYKRLKADGTLVEQPA